MCVYIPYLLCDESRLTIIATGVVLPLGADGGTSSSGDKLRSDTSTVDIAGDGRAGEGLDGVVVGGRADVLVLSITLVLAVDPDAADGGVGVDGAEEAGSGGENGGLEEHGCGYRVSDLVQELELGLELKGV